MKKFTIVSLIIVLLSTGATKSTFCMDGDDEYTVRIKLPAFPPIPPIAISPDSVKNFEDAMNKLASSALISSVGLVVSSVGLMLIYKGIIAHSSQVESAQTPSDKLDSSKLFAYGTALVITGLMTIMHNRISNLFTSQKP